jgi:hypothetical protein
MPVLRDCEVARGLPFEGEQNTRGTALYSAPDGTILIARRVDAETRQHFGVHAGMNLATFPKATAPYSARHREAFYAREEVRA